MLDFTEDQRFKEIYMKEQLPCIFLNRETNTCFVYEVRCLVQNESTEFCNKKVQSFMA